MNFIQKAAGLVDRLGRPFSKVNTAPEELKQRLHPLDDPEVWLEEPMHQAPAGVDVKREQAWIDNLMGTTRGGQPIYKLVWNGDRSFWHEYFTEWDGLGAPTKPPLRRPRIRYKVVRDRNRKIVRDVFPPRWLILTRIEPEQYADSWEKESFVIAPELSHYAHITDPRTGQLRIEQQPVYKQVRPSQPPPVFWLWFATIAHHTDHCCATRARNEEKCFGEYAPPSYLRPTLELQRQADLAAGNRNPFAKVESEMLNLIEEQQNGYLNELYALKAESEIFAENPLALIGPIGSLKAEIDDPKTAERIVREFYDRELQRAAKL